MPSPATYTPALWAEYQDTLLRYERLLRAGDQAGAARMAGRLRDLELKIGQAEQVNLSSMQNTLAMPAAAGGATACWGSWNARDRGLGCAHGPRAPRSATT